jgi:Ca-activated chloride channel family protein
MKKLLTLIPILTLMVLILAGCGRSAERLNNEGNEAFADQDYEGALVAYHQAQQDDPALAEPHYNAANTHYRQSDYEQAQQEIEQALIGEEQQGDLAQAAYYNLGNTFFRAQQYDAAIQAYQEVLRLNPDDLEAKQNLELALRQLQQQQENQEQQEDQQQDQQQQDGQNDEQNEDQQDQRQQDDQNDEQNEDQQDQRQQDGQNDAQNEEQQQGDQNDQRDDQQDQQQAQQQASGKPQQLTGLSEEQARQLFAAAAQDTESLEEYLQQIYVFPWAPPAEDW